MFTYDEIKSNYEIIKDFAIKYRVELTAIASILSNELGLTNDSDYEKFMNEMSTDEFVGNYFTALMIRDAVTQYRSVLNGKTTFEEFVKSNYALNLYEKYLTKINSIYKNLLNN